MSDVPTIGFQDGISATEQRLENLDPAVGEVAYQKEAATLDTLKLGHNEVWKDGGIADRLAAAEGQLARLPFPFAASSTPPGA